MSQLLIIQFQSNANSHIAIVMRSYSDVFSQNVIQSKHVFFVGIVGKLKAYLLLKCPSERNNIELQLN